MKDVIIALDFRDRDKTMEFLRLFHEPVFVKVGMELYYAEGPEIVKEIKHLGHQVFLDLKFHDIPNTVRGAVRSCLGLGCDMINLHASGGRDMMEAAMEEVSKAQHRPLVIAVTILTSMNVASLNEDLHVEGTMEESVLRLARMTKESGLQGVVCSALEAKKVKEVLGEGFLTITPGVRPAGNEKGDQSRVVTPAMARELGSDFIVVGRPITEAEDPYETYQRIKEEFLGGNV